jgi:hypothetical protein
MSELKHSSTCNVITLSLSRCQDRVYVSASRRYPVQIAERCLESVWIEVAERTAMCIAWPRAIVCDDVSATANALLDALLDASVVHGSCGRD